MTSLASFAHARGIALTDPELIPTFTANAGEQLAAALNDDALLHGTRIERLFEAMEPNFEMIRKGTACGEG